MRKITFCIVALFITLLSHAQTYGIKTFGGPQSDEAQAIATDAAGNVYITGTFQGTVDFDPSSGTAMLTAAADPNNPDAFVQKFDVAGNFVWVKTFQASPASIATDIAGNVYVTGGFHDTTDLDPGFGVSQQISTGGNDIFVQKLDADGTFLWSKSFGDSLADDYSRAITTDILGNVFVTGNFTGNVDFDPGPGTDLHSSNGFADIYIHKMDASGNYQWTKTFGSSNTDYGYSVTTDAAGNVYAAGLFLNTVDFDPGAGIDNHTSNGSFDAYVLKLNISGNLLWAKTFGGAGDDEAFAVSINPYNTVYVMGAFSETVDFDPNGGTASMTSNGMHDVFILEMNVGGNLVWVKTFGGAGEDYAVSLAAGTDGNIYTTGYFNGIVDFNPGSETVNHNFSDGDAFVQKLSANGDYIWSKTFGAGAGHSTSHGIAVAGATVYVTGYFTHSVDFAGGTAVDIHSSNGDTDGYLWQYSCINSTSSITVLACRTYLSPAGNIYTQGGIYTDVIVNAAGCDSIITINLTIDTVDTSVLQYGNALTANEGNASYQWLNCASGNQIYEETGISYLPAVNGSYAVIISKNNCVDTSECIAVTLTGIVDEISKNDIVVYPNPGTGNVYIKFAVPQINTLISVFSLDGKLVQKTTFSGSKALIDLNTADTGTYFIEIMAEGSKQTHKIALE